MNYTDKYLDIYADGKLVLSRCALRNDASGSYTPNKPMTMTVNMTDAGAANSGMKLYSTILDEYYSGTVSITDKNGYAANPNTPGEVMAIADASFAAMGAEKLYIAAYDSAGRLSAVNAAEVEENANTSTGLVTIPECGYAKAFLWDNSMRPIK